MTAPGDETKATVEVELEDALSAEATVTAKSTEEMAREIKALNRHLLLLDKRAKSAALSVAELDAATAKYHTSNQGLLGTTNKVTAATKKYTGAQSKATTALTKHTSATKKADKESNKFTRTLKKLFTIVDAGGRGLRPQTIGMIGLVTAIAGGIGPAIQLAAALSSLAGFLVAIPTAIDVLLLSAATLMVAFKGVAQGFTAAISGDWQEFYDAVKDLSPAAQHFLMVIRKYRGTFKDIRKSVQEALFLPFTKKLIPLIETLAPVFKKGMTELAGVFGNTIGHVFDFFTSGKGVKSIQTLFENAIHFAHVFDKAITPVMEGFASLVIGIAPGFDKLSDGVGNLLTRFGDWLKKIGDSGKALEWLNQAMVIAGLFADTLKLVGQILLDISHAAGGISVSPLSALLTLIHNFTSSPEGQGALTSIFQTLGVVIKALGPVVAALGSVLGNVLVPILGDIITTLAPYVAEFLRDIGTALETTRPIWGQLADGVGKLLIALTPLLPLIAQILVVVGTELGNLLQQYSPLIQFLLTALAEPLIILFQTIGQVLQASAPFIAQFFQMIGALLEAVAPFITQFGVLFGKYVAKFIADMLPLLQKELPIWEHFFEVFGGQIIMALRQLVPMLPKLFDAFFALLSIFSDPMTMQGILLFLKFGTQLLIQFTPLIPAFTQLAILGIELIIIFFRFLGAIQSIVTWAAKGFGEFVRKVLDITKPIRDAIIEPFESLLKRAEEIFLSIVGKIEEFVHKAQEAFKKFNPGEAIQKGLKTAFSFIPGLATGGPALAGQKYNVGEIGKEMWIPGNGGNPQMIGVGGPETRSFPTDGYVIPNAMVKAMEASQRGMAAELARMEGSNAAVMASEMKALVGAGAGSGGDSHHHYDVTLKFPPGVGTNATPRDIEKAVKKALKEIEQDKKERR